MALYLIVMELACEVQSKVYTSFPIHCAMLAPGTMEHILQGSKVSELGYQHDHTVLMVHL